MLVRGLRSVRFNSPFYRQPGAHLSDPFTTSRLGSPLRLASVPASLPRPVTLRPKRFSHLPCRSVSQSTTSMGRGVGSKTEHAPPKTSTIPVLSPPPRFRRLSFTDGRVCTEDGTPILEGVSTQAWTTSGPDSDYLVLGVETSDGPACLADFPLGVLRCKRWLACARNKLWWMTPEWGVRGRDLPPETQFLLMELDTGEYVIMLPLIDADTFRGTLRPPRNSGPNGLNPNGSDLMYLRMESGDDAVLGTRWPHALLLASGDDPFALVDAAVPEAAKYSGTAKPLREKRLPPSIDKFAWCSWDAFYSSVSAQGLIDGVQSLKAGGAPPKLVIIDDGWQSTDLESKFKGWQDPGAAIIASAKEKMRSLNGSIDDVLETEQIAKEIARELYIEGESEMISAVLRDVPAGSSTGKLLQEIKAADDESLESIDYYTMAKQHDAFGSAPGEEDINSHHRHNSRRHRNVITRASLAVGQYVAGLVVGALQALIILFYQWVVDPAADGTWPVKFFSYLTAGPLRDPMLQFYADQTNFTRRLVDVRANAKFHGPEATPEAVHSGKPEDLASVVAHLRTKLDVDYIYCWHGLSAYWSGVCPESPAMRKYRPRLVYARPPRSLREIEPSMLWNPSVLGGLGAVYDPAPLFRDMHTYLAAAGVTGVKVDCQAGVGMVGSVTGGGSAVAARYHAALEASVAEHFPDNDAINCMCHSTENIYRWKDTAVARASDDFFPTDTASHMPHVAACAFNGLFISALALPDFDMFQSRHVVASLHAAARAVSGGPVYVSDAPGHHNFEILHQLVLPDGGVLRALLPGRPTRDCLFLDVLRDGKSLLKIWNMNAHTGVVGIFNLQGSSWDRNRRRFAFHSTSPPRLTTTVRVIDVEPIAAQLSREKSQRAEQGVRGVEAGHWAAAHVHPLATDSNSNSSNGNAHSQGIGGYESDISSAADRAVTNSGFSSENAYPSNGIGKGTAANGHGDIHHHHRMAVRPDASGDFAAYVNTSGKLFRLPAGGGIDLTLDGSHASVVTFARVSREMGVEFAALGLKNMLNGGGAVRYVEVEADRSRAGLTSALSDSGTDTESYADLVTGELMTDFEDGGSTPPVLPRFHVGLRGRGTLLALCSREPVLCTVDGYEVGFTYDGAESRLEVDVPQVGRHMEQNLVVQFRK